MSTQRTVKDRQTKTQTEKGNKPNLAVVLGSLALIIVVIAASLTTPAQLPPMEEEEAMPLPPSSTIKVESTVTQENQTQENNQMVFVPTPKISFGNTMDNPTLEQNATIELETLIASGENAGLFEGLPTELPPGTSELTEKYVEFITAFGTEGRESQLRMHEIALWLRNQQMQFPDDESIPWVMDTLREDMDSAARLSLGKDAIPWVANAYTGLKSLGFGTDAEILLIDQKTAIRQENLGELLAQDTLVTPIPTRVETQEPVTIEPHEETDEPEETTKIIPETTPGVILEPELDTGPEQETLTAQDLDTDVGLDTETSPNNPKLQNNIIGAVNLRDFHLGISSQFVLTTLRDLYEVLRENEMVHTSWEVASVKRVSEDLYEFESKGSTHALSYTRTIITFVATDDPTFELKYNVVWPLMGSPMKVGDVVQVNNLARVGLRILQRITKEESE